MKCLKPISSAVLVLLLMALSQSAFAATFVLDSLTGTAGANLTTHTGTTGATWAVNSATSGNPIVFTTTPDATAVRNSVVGDEFYYASGTPATADYDVQCEFVRVGSPTSGWNVVIGRESTSAKTGYVFGFFPSSGWRLYRWSAGAALQIGSTVSTPLMTAGTTYTVKLTMRGTTISGYVNGTLVVTGTDATITAAGLAGIGGNGGTNNLSDTIANFLRNFSATDAGLTAGAITANTTTSTAITPQLGTIAGGTAPYSTVFSYSTATNGTYTNIGTAVTGAAPVANAAATGLTAATTYYFRAITTDSTGTPLTLTSPSASTGTPLITSAAVSISMTTTETYLPTNHIGATIAVHVVGSGTTFTTGTGAVGTQFSITAPAGWSYVNTNKTFVDATHYTLLLTCPAAATPPAGATGSVVITDTTDTLSAGIAVNTPTISVSPSSAAAGATPTLTITGTNTLYTRETAAGLFGVSGGTGASFATPTISSDTSATDVLTVGSTAGTLTITGNSTGATTTFTVTAAAVTISVTDANWYFSPFNTYSDGAGTLSSYNVHASSTFCQWNNPGSYFKFAFTGSTTFILNVDTTPLSGAAVPAASYPYLRYSIDNTTWVDIELVSGSPAISLSGLSAGNHTFYCLLQRRDGGYDSWVTPANVVKMTSITLAAGGSSIALTGAVAVLPNTLLDYGDSTIEGVNINSTGFAGNDASASNAVALGVALNAEVGVVGWASQGYTRAGTGSVPIFNLPGTSTTWDKYDSVHSRLIASKLSPVPTYIINSLGNNDARFSYPNVASQAVWQTEVSNWLTVTRTAAPTSKVFLQVPYGQYSRANLLAAYNAYQTATPDTSTYYIDLGNQIGIGLEQESGSSVWSTDCLHPNTLKNAQLAAATALAIQSKLTGGATTNTKGSHATPKGGH